jgi:choline dehydrogenase
VTSLLTPRSRGTVELCSADPLDAPHVDPAYLAHEQDRARLRAGVRLARHLPGTDRLAASTGPALDLDGSDDKSLDQWVSAPGRTTTCPPASGGCR